MPFPSYESDCFNKLYPKQLKLTKVQLIHRHGERTPVSNDKPIWSQCAIIPHLSAFHDFVRTHPETLINFDNITFPGDLSTLEVSRQLPLYNSNGECMPGQLTDTGKHSMLTMGKNLRTLYSDQLNFFSAQNPRNLYLRSTGYVRTIESLQYLLTGMFPAGIPNVPLNILSNEHENMYPNGHNCYKLRELSKQFRKSQSELLKPLIDKVSAELSHFHPVKPDAISLGDLNDYYLCKSGNNVHHDPSFTKEIKRNLEEISVKTFWNQWQDDHQLARLSIGRFVNVFTANIGSKGRSKESRIEHLLWS